VSRIVGDKRPDPLVGAVIAGRYRIEARIASGGMGTVYRAEQLGLDRKVAVKLLHAGALEGTLDSQTDDDVAVLEKRFSREAAILARLAHPNVVTIFDYGSVEDAGAAHDPTRPRFYMAMELLGGETLQDRLTKRKQLPLEETLNLVRQIARGLREAHALGIVHRDLKPANVMIVRDRDGEEVVKLLDFGIGKVINQDAPISSDDPRAELTQEGRFVGSPMYMAPEQIAHGRVDLRTDIYAIGTVLYRCLAGAHPFHKDNTALVMLAHLHEKPVSLADRVPELPRWLTDLVDRCMEKEPNLRPQSMDEVLKTLTEMAPLSSGSRISLPYNPIPPLPPTEEPKTVAIGGPELLTPHTNARPVTLTGAQPAAPKRPPWLVVAIVAVFALGAALVVVTRRPTTERQVAPPPPAASTARTYTLSIESTPSGAEVSEDERLVGHTPLELPIDNEAAKTKPRTFVLRAPGHQPHTVVRGPSEQSVRLSIVLLAEPTTTTSATHTAKTPPSKPPPAKTMATAPPPPSDINLKR